MSSIYNITTFSNLNSYNRHSVVKYSGSYNGLTLSNEYLYALKDIAPGAFNATDWGGMGILNGTTRPVFLWTPDYKNSAENKARVNIIKFGDGYEKRQLDGLNNKLLVYSLNFNARSQAETIAITNFLDATNGVKSFIYNSRIPYIKPKLYVCDAFTVSEEFENNFNITCEFREVVN